MGQLSDMMGGGAGASAGGTPGPSSAPWASAAGPAPGDTNVQIPQGQPGDPSSDPTHPDHPLQQNLSLMQRFANLLGATPEERTKNAKQFAAMVKDVGSMGASMQQGTLMKRMMKEQMRMPMAVMGGGGPAGGVAAIPRSFDPGEAAASMNRTGFK
jgi:hypothetical protein